MTLLSGAYRKGAAVEVVVSGARGPSDYQIWRDAGNAGTYADYLDFLAAIVIANNPGFKGDKGNPGGNVMAIGLFTEASALNIPNGTDVVRTSGHTRKGIGLADYVSDDAVTAGYVTANPRSSFRSANGRGFRLLWQDALDVTWLGALGDEMANDQPAIQAAINMLKARKGGVLHIPLGDFCIDAPLDCGSLQDGLNRAQIRGTGGGVGFGGEFKRSGSRIVGRHAGNIFQWSSGERVEIVGLTIDGNGCSAVMHTGVAAGSYCSEFRFRDVYFGTNLKECIFGTFIFPQIDDVLFGYYGTPSRDRPGNPPHRHIYIMGTATPAEGRANLANMIRISNSRFYSAMGSESIFLGNGAGAVLFRVNSEQNDCIGLRVAGIKNLTIEQSFFEKNRNTEHEIEIDIGTVVGDLSGLKILQSQFVHDDVTQRVVLMKTQNFDADGWEYDCVDSGLPVTNDYSRLATQKGEAQIVDGSGAGLVLNGGAAKFNRVKNTMTIRYDLIYPNVIGVDAAAQVARVRGYPFICKGTVFALVGSNTPGGVEIGTDAGGASAVFYKSGTLTPFTNGELAGKTLYVQQTIDV